ncbi:uncharacterized protein LOC123222569 [Mangifera indica]|uniref:uncharacterized protein LOC123222569 n=1 Tax=Mangifera indica TaxID=29780 RepID=UPI001CFC0B51|nr:uncharacterized protein LOC123222569 [Mangifera indica]
MEAKVEEALRAKEIAEKRFTEKDFAGAKNYALKAKTLCPGLEGIAQMVATYEVYFASEIKCNGEIDYYSILGVKPSANQDAVKNKYKKMAVLLHPDKNKCVGADGAFKLVSEAWTLLSDHAARFSYDLRRNKQVASGVVQTNLSSAYTTGITGHGNYSNLSTSHARTRLDTFWTVCTSCKVQYEYLRKYVNKRLSCKNCRGTFIAVETGTAPVNGSFPYCPWSYVSSKGYGSHGYDGVAYAPTNATIITGNGIAGFHSGHAYEYVSNVSFQWSSHSGTSTGIVTPNGSSAMSSNAGYQMNGHVNGAGSKVKSGSNGKHSISGSIEPSGSRSSRPDKRRKVVVSSSFRNGSEIASEANLVNGNAYNEHDHKLVHPTEPPNKRCSMAPAFDARKLLIEKARSEIWKQLKLMTLATKAAVVEEKSKALVDAGRSRDASKSADLFVPGYKSGSDKSGLVAITVPDPDFHDFDKDRSEECFKPKQIWAIYDEDDGMPRLYCLIRQVISTKPFKILITYLNSKTDSEFGSVNWVEFGFTKSCGHFRAWNSDVVDQVNIFSHLLRGEKAGRGGCIRIFPKCGEIWAVYRNWSRDWDRSTPDNVRHQYEMVEVLDDYSEELGVCVAPLIKLTGFKTVYQRNTDKNAIKWIPRREMLRFSHQVPSWLLQGETSNLPGKCWDLDPAATPDELLHAAKESNA